MWCTWFTESLLTPHCSHLSHQPSGGFCPYCSHLERQQRARCGGTTWSLPSQFAQSPGTGLGRPIPSLTALQIPHMGPFNQQSLAFCCEIARLFSLCFKCFCKCYFRIQNFLFIYTSLTLILSPCTYQSVLLDLKKQNKELPLSLFKSYPETIMYRFYPFLLYYLCSIIICVFDSISICFTCITITQMWDWGFEMVCV